MKKELKNFYDLDAWEKGHQIVLDVYQITKQFPKEELYGPNSQLRRAAASVTANIAEGFERYHFKDKIRFYYQARGSLAEVQNFLILAKDLGFIDLLTCQRIGQLANEVRRLINGLIKSISAQK